MNPREKEDGNTQVAAYGLGRPQAGPGSDLPYSRSKTFAMMRNASSKVSRIFILPSLDVGVI